MTAGKAVQGLGDIGGANARHHDLVDVRKLDLIGIGKFSEGAVNGGNGIVGLNEEGSDEVARRVKAYDFGRASADVDADDNTHWYITPYDKRYFHYITHCKKMQGVTAILKEKEVSSQTKQYCRNSLTIT